MSQTVLDQVVELSHRLGRPEADCVILAEGNTSARQDAQTFWVKASGVRLESITSAGFVRVVFAPLLDLLAGPELDDPALKQALDAAKVDARAPGRPSVETLLHAEFLGLEGVSFVGHTHPTVVNALTCSRAFPEALAGRLFPDEIVVCGIAPLLVPYTDPGFPLARRIGGLLKDYLNRYGQPPKTAWIQNHGLVALGRTAQQVEDVTAMAIKTARIVLGTYAAGGPRFLSAEDVERIDTRPDELYRQQVLGLEKGTLDPP